MNVGSMQQMQAGKMDGFGGGQGQGQGNMREIMQSLSTEDRAKVKEQMSSLSQDERIAAVTKMKEIDAVSLNAEDYTQALLDILNNTTTDDTESDIFSVYA